ncbi:hypothetical protein [Rhodovulum adriaticum]|uniref:PD-(D/E)XK nuclease superfamily protein n=1 Tax=Rhodovulum adriaticum TaxID=35804 RepID=A0A4R2NGD2_RHOAD|nr:hypothetical protein [Rhodovulum adriaticum]MBK1636859.1 hypothetical protein [Rhodovulum adriaticum]TCP20268.1 hypothetical protein EV656_1212 [Rhodovulum adriaticum]
MNEIPRRIREAEIDALIERLLRHNSSAVGRFLAAAIPDDLRAPVRSIARQTRHRGSTGTIDLEIVLRNGLHLLVENKVDAGWSVTGEGEPQPERYRGSVSALLAEGVPAFAVLVAPLLYLSGSRHAAAFHGRVAYETLAEGLGGSEERLLRAAILQAETPYEPVPNALSGQFFYHFEELVRSEFPRLVLKRNPNGGDTRPTASRTFYFEAKRMLSDHPGVPLPRISLQAWDSNAPSASAKLMIGGWGRLAGCAPAPDSLTAIGAYLRPAGRSLGIVMDTPRLDTQAPFEAQREAVREGLQALGRLQTWWNDTGADMASWHVKARERKS